MNIFRYLNYKAAISDLVQSRKKLDKKYTFSHLADTLRVQKTYISKVLHGDGHFSADQLYLTAKFLSLSQDETDFLLLLLELERCQTPGRKRELQAKVHHIQSLYRDTRKHLQAQMVDPEQSLQYAEYYLDPLALLIHTYLSVPECGDQPKVICQRLGLDESTFSRILKMLERLEIVRWDSQQKKYLILRPHIQLSKKSPIHVAYQLLLRSMASEHVKNLPEDDRFLFSATFSADEAARRAVHEEFLLFLKKAEAIIRDAPPTSL